jgi:hypothetical protein
MGDAEARVTGTSDLTLGDVRLSVDLVETFWASGIERRPADMGTRWDLWIGDQPMLRLIRLRDDWRVRLLSDQDQPSGQLPEPAKAELRGAYQEVRAGARPERLAETIIRLHHEFQFIKPPLNEPVPDEIGLSKVYVGQPGTGKRR